MFLDINFIFYFILSVFYLIILNIKNGDWGLGPIPSPQIYQ